ncbi:MAG: hypothetical protein ACO1SV_12105 [Fimbriimonas sp.]
MRGTCGLLLGLVVIAGCASPPVTPAVAKRKGPCFVRVYNLAGEPIDAWIDSQLAADDLPVGHTTGFRITPPKTQSTRAMTSAEQGEFKSDLKGEPDGIYTLLALTTKGKPSFALLTGEPRSAKAGSALVTFASASDSLLGTGTVKSGEKEASVGELQTGTITKAIEVTPGAADFKVTRNGKVVAEASAPVETGKAYTVFLWENEGKAELIVSDNNPKVSLGGAAAGTPMG